MEWERVGQIVEIQFVRGASGRKKTAFALSTFNPSETD